MPCTFWFEVVLICDVKSANASFNEDTSLLLTAAAEFDAAVPSIDLKVLLSLLFLSPSAIDVLTEVFPADTSGILSPAPQPGNDKVRETASFLPLPSVFNLSYLSLNVEPSFFVVNKPPLVPVSSGTFGAFFPSLFNMDCMCDQFLAPHIIFSFHIVSFVCNHVTLHLEF